MIQIMLEQAQKIASDWAAYMEIDPTSFEIQVGSFDGLPPECLDGVTDEHYGVTFSYPDRPAIVCIRDTCPEEKLVHVIVHELVHVYSFAACGPDERENMELVTDQCALLIQRLRELEAA